MASFQKRIINRTQTLGEKIQAIRVQRGLDLANISKKLEIPLKYLENIEAGQYQNLPGDVYTKAWLKKYAKLLGLSGEEFLADYQIEKNIAQRVVKISQTKETNKTAHPLLRPRLWRWALVVLAAGALLAYLIWEIINIITPPALLIISPENNFKTNAYSLEIIGQTQSEAQVTINSEPVFLDSQGNFKKDVNLVLGLNNLEISAKKKHSRTRYLQLVILREAVE